MALTIMRVAWIVGNVGIALALGLWQRSLIVYLYTHYRETWQKLGREDVTGVLWPLSVRLPVGSWRSQFFFLFKRYETLGDSEFSERAARFRICSIVWLLQLPVFCVVNLVLG